MDHILDQITTHPVLIVLVVVGLLFGFRIFRRRKIDAQFGVKKTGGRYGEILVRKGANLWRAEYEVGSRVDLIIYGSSLTTADNRPLSEPSRTDMVEALMAWAKARGTTIEIAKDA